MKDNHGNEAPCDFKNILFNNRYTFNDTDGNGNYVDGSVLSKRFKNNTIKKISNHRNYCLSTDLK